MKPYSVWRSSLVWSFAFKRLGPRPRPRLVHINLKTTKDWTEPLQTGLHWSVSVLTSYGLNWFVTELNWSFGCNSSEINIFQLHTVQCSCSSMLTLLYSSCQLVNPSPPLIIIVEWLLVGYLGAPAKFNKQGAAMKPGRCLSSWCDVPCQCCSCIVLTYGGGSWHVLGMWWQHLMWWAVVWWR